MCLMLPRRRSICHLPNDPSIQAQMSCSLHSREGPILAQVAKVEMVNGGSI